MRRVRPRSVFRSGRSTGKTGNRLPQQLIDEATREPIDGNDKARGYEIGKRQFLLVEDQDLEAIEIGSTHTIDIDSFVPRAEIDQRFFDTPCYITPNDPVGQDGHRAEKGARAGTHTRLCLPAGSRSLRRRKRRARCRAGSYRP